MLALSQLPTHGATNARSRFALPADVSLGLQFVAPHNTILTNNVFFLTKYNCDIFVFRYTLGTEINIHNPVVIENFKKY